MSETIDLVAGREALDDLDEVEAGDAEPHARAHGAVAAHDEDLLDTLRRWSTTPCARAARDRDGR